MNFKEYVSPKSSCGSFAYSVLVHAVALGALILILGIKMGSKETASDFVEMEYEVFNEPPVPAQQERRVASRPDPETIVDSKSKPDDSAKELQDEKGDVAGTQAAQNKPASPGAEGHGDAASTPYYKIKPKYPRAALASGIEGWVLMQIDVNEQGEVENVRVVDGEQRNMFQSEARRAVEQWKYKPFIDDTGKAIRKENRQVRVDFKLRDGEVATN